MRDYFRRLSEDLWEEYKAGTPYLASIALALQFIVPQWEKHGIFEEQHARVLLDVLWNYDGGKVGRARKDTALKSVEAYVELYPMVQKGERSY